MDIIGERLLVEPIKDEEVTSFGLILVKLPEHEGPKKFDKGKVKAVGTGKVICGHRFMPEAKVGDTVIYVSASAQPTDDGIIIKGTDVLCILD